MERIAYPNHLKLLEFPDPKLEEVSSAVTEFNAGLSRFCSRLVQLMRDQKAVGISAPQVGVPKRIMVVAIPSAVLEIEEWPYEIMINPSYTPHHEETMIDSFEGCLSFPGGDGFEVKRWKRIDAHWDSLTGSMVYKKLEGLESVCFQHELDHLDGILLPDRKKRSS